MLKNLLIKNYVLIKKLDITLSSALNIITGETGAGKSIMLGALGLLLGKRADSKSLFSNDKKCIIEAEFEVASYALTDLFDELDLDYENPCLIRREISPNGKSRAFINDTPVNLATLKRISTRLLDIHSQHDTLLLGSENYQRELVDIFAENQSIFQIYQKTYQVYRKAEKAYQNLKKEAQEITQELDYQTFLFQELEKAELDDISQEDLEQKLNKLENAEMIKTNLNLMLEQLSKSEFSAENLIQSILLTIRPIAEFSKNYQQLYQRLESTSFELQDIAQEIENEEDSLFFDQDEFEEIQNQLSQIYHLQNKHKVQTISELLSIREELRIKTERAANFDEELENLDKNRAEAYKKLLKQGKKLTASRQKIAPKIQKELVSKLQFVGMQNARFGLQITPRKPDLSGCDIIEFLFSANKGIAPQPLKNAASGGEFSRLMLCLKRMIAGKMALPSIIFDEIDTGISGEIAIKVSQLLNEMAREHQLLVISHLPQTAANGKTHFFVYKENGKSETISRIRKLSAQERITEIAQMIGGKNFGKSAVQSAKELLEMY